MGTCLPLHNWRSAPLPPPPVGLMTITTLVVFASRSALNFVYEFLRSLSSALSGVWIYSKSKHSKLTLTTPWRRIGEWGYSSTHSLTSALDGGEWSASRPGRFTPWERAPGTHWIGGWAGSGAVLDAVVKRKIPKPRRESNTTTPIVQPVAQRYTDWAITALYYYYYYYYYYHHHHHHHRCCCCCCCCYYYYYYYYYYYLFFMSPTIFSGILLTLQKS
jgi:hypothetical protein